jgi:putative PIN family toxin of toxin-antitoxin system
MIRALVDANILISVLLAHDSNSPPATMVEWAFAGAFEILVSGTSFAELADRIQTKPYLRDRISPEDAQSLVNALTTIAQVLPEITEVIPAHSRDRKDDYLLALSSRHHVDYLVTGDEDLLVLGEHAGVRIVSPADFVAILDDQFG